MSKKKAFDMELFFAALADRTVCLLNSGESPAIVFTQQGKQREVKEPAIMELLQRGTLT